MNAVDTVNWMFSKDNPNSDYNKKHYGSKKKSIKTFFKTRKEI